jgi:hypothetical protein
VLSHKQKLQGKANALSCFAMLICAACVCRGVVEVVALLGSIQRGLCCSSAVRGSKLVIPQLEVAKGSGFLLAIFVDGGLRPRARDPGGSAIIKGWSSMSSEMR